MNPLIYTINIFMIGFFWGFVVAMVKGIYIEVSPKEEEIKGDAMKLIKKKNKTKKQKSHEVELGNLYDINKNIVEKNIKPMTIEEIKVKTDTIKNFILEKDNKYYMLLCNDLKDYTVFNLSNREECAAAVQILLEECLPNRGAVKTIDLTPDEDAIEIWISIEQESYCYYFFPYDLGIIEC